MLKVKLFSNYYNFFRESITLGKLCIICNKNIQYL